MTLLQYALYLTQLVAIVVLFVNAVYIATLNPSKYQIQVLLLVISTLVMLVGYTVEVLADNASEALSGAAVAYIGKPFAAVMAFVFIAQYCDRPLPRAMLYFLVVVSAVFPIILFTNGQPGDAGHHLYYANVSFDETRQFSKMVITRGSLYYTYMVFLIAVFSAIFVYIIRAYLRSKNKETRHQLCYIFAMVGVTVLGYAMYLSGITQGYDTTMTGAALGTFLLSVLFYRYKIFDTLTLAKEKALHNASNGLLVVNAENKCVYSNAVIDHLLRHRFTAGELLSMPDGMADVKKDYHVYEIKKEAIMNGEVKCGTMIETRDITEKYNYSAQLEKDVEARTKELRGVQRAIIAGFSGIVEARDNATGEHIKRMAAYVEILAKELQRNGDYEAILTDEYIERLVEVSPLHDVGKLSVPDSVLLKPGRLTPEEFDVIKTHAQEGARIIEQTLAGVERPNFVALAEDTARHHHEKWNGTGYPDGLAGDEIPLCARIVAIADVYDAIRSERCYKSAMTKEEARAVIEEGRGSHFDPVIVDAFFRAVDKIESV